MKNSKIFLSASAVVLAIASAFTTKAVVRPYAIAYPQTVGGKRAASVTTNCLNTGTNTCRTAVNGRKLYTSRTTFGTCGRAFKTAN